MTRLVVASANPGKLREFAALLAPFALEPVPQAALGITSVAETGTTFEANALLKARHAAACAHLPALADDSGLEVDALGGAPGVYSARYAGATASDVDNLARLLRALVGVPESARTARYQCVIAFVRGGEDPQPLLARGTWEGRIASAAAGTGGFGYDPVFVPVQESCTAAQLGAARKNLLSHRGQALRALIAQLPGAGYSPAP
ncbi:MAG: RdgB/HAM1 family non-canonical purine NTP pyrophosphatase [Gammaproteobacteria bacterium]|nr:RdgB/HAM1 family non-canonical purine NTP pyrophosphatase [Gammaproteobacteria bacterium]